jgi:hypothetical protein
MPQHDRSARMPAFRHPAAAARTVPVDAIALAVPGTPNMPFMERPSTTRAGGGYYLGAAGSRKTTIALHCNIEAIAYEYANVPPEQRRSFLFADLKGDFSELVLGALARIPGVLNNTNFINPFARNGAPGQVPINVIRADRCGLPADLLSRQFAHHVGYMSGSGALAVPLGGRQRELIAATAYAAWETPGSSPVWIADALSHPNGLDRLAAICTNDRARSRLQSVRVPPDVLAATGTRVREVICPYAEVENMFGASTSIDWGRLTAPGAVTILNLGDPPGGSIELVEFFANLLIRQCFEFLMFSRQSPWHGHGTTIVIDEANLAAVALQDVLRRVVELARSRNCQLFLICQGTRTLRDASGALFEALITNSRYAITGRLASADAALYVREALGPGVPPATANRIASELISLPPGEFYFSEANGAPIRFKAVEADREGWARASREKAQEIEAMKRRLCPQPLPPAVHLDEAPMPPTRARATEDLTTEPPPRRRPRSRLG